MLMVVGIHAYNLNPRYLQPWTTPAEQLTVTSFTEYLLSNGLFRFCIPMFAAISGYLYAGKDDEPYKLRTRKRVLTLLLPYLVWSGLILVFIYLFEMYPASNKIIAASHVLQIDSTRMLLHDYHWYELLARWILFPATYQLWFIRVLFIYNLAYPAISWCVTHRVAKWIFFFIALFLWLSTAGLIIVEGESLLFFSIGIWMRKNHFSIDKPTRLLNPAAWGLLYISLAVIQALLAFKGQALLPGNSLFMVLIVLYKLVVLSGLVTAWYGTGRLVEWCMNRKWFVSFCSFSFIIYVVHAPLIAFAIDPVFQLLHSILAYRIITYIILPFSLIAFSILVGVLLKKLVPTVYAFLTGGRG